MLIDCTVEYCESCNKEKYVIAYINFTCFKKKVLLLIELLRVNRRSQMSCYLKLKKKVQIDKILYLMLLNLY